MWHVTLGEGGPRETHLLAVAGDHLIVSGQRLWCLDVATGQRGWEGARGPFPGPDSLPLQPMGRGVVAGDLVYWPAGLTAPTST